MRLNTDVLVVVMQHLESDREVNAMMMTCKTLYDAGLPFLIAHYSERSLSVAMTFLDFLLADLCKRGPLLRSLKLKLDLTLSDGGHGAFYTAVESILSKATQLVELELMLPLPGDDVMIGPTLIAGCTSLTSLSLGGLTHPAAAALFFQMRSLLKSISLEFARDPNDEKEHPLFPISDHLHHFAGSLEDLSLFSTRWSIDVHPSSCWPKMEALYASDLPTRGSMSAAFPRLETLDIHTTGATVYGPPEMHWTHLDDVALSLAGLERLLPACTVRELEVYTTITTRTASRFTELLRRTNPQALTLTLNVDVDESRATQLWEAAPRLHCLILYISGPFSLVQQVSCGTALRFPLNLTLIPRKAYSKVLPEHP